MRSFAALRTTLRVGLPRRPAFAGLLAMTIKEVRPQLWKSDFHNFLRRQKPLKEGLLAFHPVLQPQGNCDRLDIDYLEVGLHA